MTLTVEVSNGAMKGTLARPTSAADDLEDDTDGEGAYLLVGVVGTCFFRRRGRRPVAGDATP